MSEDWPEIREKSLEVIDKNLVKVNKKCRKCIKNREKNVEKSVKVRTKI